MGQRGFSLIELLVIIVIMGGLLAAATLEFNRYTQKAGIESQIQTVYAELMQARSEALLQKAPRSFSMASGNLTIYPLANGVGTPLRQKSFKYPVTFDSAAVISFDTQGVASSQMTVCVEPAGNPGYVDSVLISATTIQLGKRRTGEACASDKIDAR